MDLEKLEDLPLRERNHDYSWENDKYHGWNFPSRRMQRWLDSRVGSHIDSTVHEYVRAKWIPKEFRQAHNLYKYLEINTFIDNGKICFYDDYFSRYNPQSYRAIDENLAIKTFYVHPVSKLICVHIPPKRKSYQKLRQEELDAKFRPLGNFWQLYRQNKIWYEIRAEITRFPSQLKPNSIILETPKDYPASFRITSKRQLSSKELKKHGLHN